MFDFKNGRTSSNEDECSSNEDEWSGRPSTSKFKPLIAQVKNIHGNCQLTAREVVEEVGISMGSCNTTLTDNLEIAWFLAKIVPRLLTGDQKLQHFSICENLLHIIISDDILVYGFDTETKQ
jgi:hypothetical protein